MVMTPLKLIALRLMSLILGPFPGGSRLIRTILMKAVRKNGKMTYVAHADFLDVRRMYEGGDAHSLHKPDVMS